MLLSWKNGGTLELDSQHFAVTHDSRVDDSTEAPPGTFILFKTREMLDRFCARYAQFDAKNVFEIGIFRGGSTAFLHQVLRPSKLVAIDLAPGPVPELTQFIATRGLEESVRCYHGVNQADRNRLREIIDTEFSDQPIDLVIDDGGHQYGETRSSFETLFPRLRPGGRFIIEDWGWAHFPTDLWQQEGGWWRDRPGLTNLVIEIMMISASAPDVVTEILVDHNVAEITRGPRELPDVVDLPSLYLNRGRRFRPLL